MHFGGLLTRLVASHQLDRIVVDECHVVLDGTKDFRPKLRELGELVLRGVQMVYLTATLPPRDETEFFRLMHIDEARVARFGARSTRKNLRYQVLALALLLPSMTRLVVCWRTGSRQTWSSSCGRRSSSTRRPRR